MLTLWLWEDESEDRIVALNGCTEFPMDPME